MRNHLRLAFIIGGASLVLGAGLLVACSDDTSVTLTDAGTDAHSDGPVGTEGGSDGGADTSPPFDGGFQVETFDNVLATEVCKALARCCYGNPAPPDGGVDGGSFDQKGCEMSYGRLGFEGSNANNELKDGGKIALDQQSADTCISKVKAMTCNLPGSEFKSIRTACFGAYSGTGAVSAACKASIECQPGLFCKVVGDAGTGACTNIRGVSGACGDFNPDRADEACSYRAGGSTGNFCKSYDLPGSGNALDAGDWQCEPATDGGTDCLNSLWCEQTVCNNNSICESPNQYFAGACDIFVK